MPPPGDAGDDRAVGLLIVHGIGEQRTGETAEKLVAGLRAVYGDRLAVTCNAAGLPARASLDRFYRALSAAIDDGCHEIQVLAHSLGTVIAYHGLTGRCLDPIGAATAARVYAPIPLVTRLYTIGSPLEKVRFFWPTTVSETFGARFSLVGGRARAAERAGDRAHRLRWDNFHHRFDVVSGRLQRFDHWGAVTNHALKGGGGLMRSHVIYEQSPEFLEVITAGLFDEPATLRQSRRSRLRDQVLSTLENLAIPVIFGVLLVVGAALGAVGVLLPGFLLALPLRLAGADWWTTLIQNVMAVLMLLVVGYASTFGVRSKARALHAIWAEHP